MFIRHAVRWYSCLTLVSLVLALGWAQPARAAGFDEAVAGIGSEDRDQLGAAILELGALDEPRALVILKALDAGQVRVDEKGGVFVQDGDKLVDARSGSPAAASGSPRQPPLN